MMTERPSEEGGYRRLSLSVHAGGESKRPERSLRRLGDLSKAAEPRQTSKPKQGREVPGSLGGISKTVKNLGCPEMLK